MKAVVVGGPHQLSVRDVYEPTPEPDEVLVKVGACGICGSDVRYLAGDNPWSLQTLGVRHENPPNMVLGHEFGGQIVAVGKSASEARVGERVAVLAYRGCHKCRYCQRGMHNLCAHVKHIGHSAGWERDELNPGGMAELCRVWDEMAFPIPEHVSYDEATFLDALAVAIHALGKAQMRLGDDVSIIGAGPVGLLILQVARLMGARSVSCFDTYDKPLEVAEGLGADASINLSKENARIAADSADVVFNTVGSESTVRDSLRALRRGGRLVLLALVAGHLTIRAGLLSGERQVLTSANNPYPCFREAVEMMGAGKISVAPMITHRFPIEQAQEAFAIAANKEAHGAIKVLILPNG